MDSITVRQPVAAPGQLLSCQRGTQYMQPAYTYPAGLTP
jgi:hypothetical protein